MEYIRSIRMQFGQELFLVIHLMGRHREKDVKLKKKNPFGKFELCLYPFSLNLLPRYALKIGMQAYWGMK